MKTSLIILFFFIVPFLLHGQVSDRIINSLHLEITKATSDTARIARQLDLADYLIDFDIEEAERIIKPVKKSLHEITDDNDYHKKLRARLYYTTSDYEASKGNFDESLYNIQKAIDIREALKDSLGLADSYYLWGSLYHDMKDSINAKRYYFKALNIEKKLRYPKNIANIYLSLGVVNSENNGKDSALYYYQKARKVDSSVKTISSVNGNIATLYYNDGLYDKAIKNHSKNIPLFKSIKDYNSLSITFQNMAVPYALLSNYKKSVSTIDSAIFYSKKVGNKVLLEQQYYTKRNIHSRSKDYKAAYEASKMHKVYSDSLNNIEQVKRFTELDLNYKFEKEKELTVTQIQKEKSKKIFYSLLSLTILIASSIVFLSFRKNSRQKIIIERNKVEFEKLKATLALANKETEFKKLVVGNSITGELLNKVLSDIKEIISYDNEEDRKKALKSLSASLLSEKATQKDTFSLQSYLDKVEIDFKIHLDQNFQQFSAKEKELVCLLKLGLTSNEISKVLNTSIPSVKSTRYRIRKKLNIDPNTDIIEYIEKEV